MTDALPHGWFTIPGIQTGERDIKERVGPLKPILPEARGATILDLGSAEGLIGKWFVEAGKAKLVHAIEKHEPWIETGRQVCKGLPITFGQMDFDDYDFTQDWMLPAYDIVLCLNIAQKLKRPKAFLLAASSMAQKFFVYSGPDAVLNDWRSEFQSVDVIALLQPKFDMIAFDKGFVSKTKGHLGVRIIFKRRTKRIRK